MPSKLQDLWFFYFAVKYLESKHCKVLLFLLEDKQIIYIFLFLSVKASAVLKHRAQPLSEKLRHPETRWDYDVCIRFWILKYRTLFLNDVFLLTSIIFSHLSHNFLGCFCICATDKWPPYFLIRPFLSNMLCSTADALNMRSFYSPFLCLFHKGLGAQILPQSMELQPNLLGD